MSKEKHALWVSPFGAVECVPIVYPREAAEPFRGVTRGALLITDGDGPMTGEKHALVDDMLAEAMALHRRLLHHTRPLGPMTLDEARELCDRMAMPLPASPSPPRKP